MVFGLTKHAEEGTLIGAAGTGYASAERNYDDAGLDRRAVAHGHPNASLTPALLAGQDRTKLMILIPLKNPLFQTFSVAYTISSKYVTR